MSLTDDMGGILGAVIVGGIAVKVADNMFDKQQKNTRRPVRRVVRPTRHKKIKGLGDLSNLGF